MPSFIFKGRDQKGDPVQGILQGESSADVADQLIAKGVVPIDIQYEHPTAEKAKGSWLRILTYSPVTPVELMLFSRQMHTLAKSGIPILRALEGLEASAHSTSFAETLKSMRARLNEGVSLSVAMADYPKIFPPIYLSMVKMGEETGQLDTMFLRLYEYQLFEKEMKARVRSTLNYPAFVVAAMALAIVIVNLFVIPTFAKVFEGFNAELPMMTQVLLTFSDWMVSYWPMLLAGLVGMVWVFRIWTHYETGRYQWGKWKLHIPIAGEIILKIVLARFSRAMAMVYKSGIPIVQGLNIVSTMVGNDYLRERIQVMKRGVRSGDGLAQTAKDAEVFPPLVLQMIAVGEETGDVDGLMSDIAELYERDIDYEIKMLSERIEPILIISLGAMVFVLALGIFLPMWNLGGAIMGH